MIVSQLGLDVGAIVAAPAIVAAKIGVIRCIVVTGSRVGVWIRIRIVVGGLIDVALIPLGAVFVPLVVVVVDDFRVLCWCASAK